MNESTREFVRRRADNRCEYCLLRQADSLLAPLHIEHVIPRKHGGDDDPDNLALACIDCNLHKGPNLSGVDSVTGQIVQLFHSRRQQWREHFEWRGIEIVGRTPTGRATIHVLNINSEEQLALRSS